MDTFSILCDDLFKLIINHTNKKDLVQMRITSTRFNKLLDMTKSFKAFKDSCDTIIDTINNYIVRYGVPSIIWTDDRLEKIIFTIEIKNTDGKNNTYPEYELRHIEKIYRGTKDKYRFNTKSSIILIDEIKTISGFFLTTSCSSKIRLAQNENNKRDFEFAEKYILTKVNEKR